MRRLITEQTRIAVVFALAVLCLVLAFFYGAGDARLVATLRGTPGISRHAMAQFAVIGSWLGFLALVLASLNALFWRWAYQKPGEWRERIQAGNAWAKLLFSGWLVGLFLLLMLDIFGAASWRLMFIVPAWVFVRLAFHHEDRGVRTLVYVATFFLLCAPLLRGDVGPLSWLGMALFAEALSLYAGTKKPWIIIKKRWPLPFHIHRFPPLMLALFIGFTILFLLAPQLDLAVAGLFRESGRESGNWWGKSFSESITNPLRIVTASLMVLGPFMIVVTSWLPIAGSALKSWRRPAFFIMSSSFVSVGLVINALFKNNAGRPRPSQTDLIAGGLGNNGDVPWRFQPPWSFAGDCGTNCSFMSGDASAGFAYLAYFLLFFGFGRLSLGLAVILGSFIGFLRMLAGRHYLSDVIFAGLTTMSLVVFCYAVFYPQKWEKSQT